jgi:hypothetical protein
MCQLKVNRASGSSATRTVNSMNSDFIVLPGGADSAPPKRGHLHVVASAGEPDSTPSHLNELPDEMQIRSAVDSGNLHLSTAMLNVLIEDRLDPLDDLLYEICCELARQTEDTHSRQTRALLQCSGIRPIRSVGVVQEACGTMHLWPAGSCLGTLEAANSAELLCGVTLPTCDLRPSDRGAFYEPNLDERRCSGCEPYADDVLEAFELRDGDAFGEEEALPFYVSFVEALHTALRPAFIAGELTAGGVYAVAERLYEPLWLQAAAALAAANPEPVLRRLMGADLRCNNAPQITESQWLKLLSEHLSGRDDLTPAQLDAVRHQLRADVAELLS